MSFAKMNPQAEPNSALPSTISNVSIEAQEQAAKAVERLSSFFPPPEVGDPRVFLAGVVELFARYPVTVMDAALDVSLGLPGKYKWWPKLPEIKEVLDRFRAPIAAQEAWNKQTKKQIAERLALTDQRPRKTFEQHQAELAAHGIYIGGAKAKASMSVVDVPALLEKTGVTKEQWDAIPNLPPPPDD